MNLKTICTQVLGVSESVGNFIKTEKNKIGEKNIETKGLHDFVTYVDKTAEEQIIAGLRTILPEAGFIAEEDNTLAKSDQYNWIIDPLDGTTNYIHGITPFAISIALAKKNKIILGVVHELGLDEQFYAWENGGAYLDGKRISVTNTNNLSSSLIATGFPYNDFNRMQPFLNTMEFFMRNTRGVRRLGSAATDLAYVACGRFDAFYEYSLNPWDVAAGSIIVTEAGGIVTDFSGGNNYIYGEEIIGCNHNMYNDFFETVKKFMIA